MGDVCLMHNADTQWTVTGERGVQKAKKIFMFKFSLFCHKRRILFHKGRKTLPSRDLEDLTKRHVRGSHYGLIALFWTMGEENLESDLI